MNMQRMGHWLTAAKKYALAHKVLSFIVLVVVVGGSYWTYGKVNAANTPVRYVLGNASTSTVVSTVSASGQISASDQIDIKAKASGEVTSVLVKVGDTVRAGQALAYLDGSDARQSLLDAQKSLQAAELQYQKDNAQAPINYQQDVDALATAKENLATDYNDTYNTISDTYLDLPAAMTSADSVINGFDIDTTKLTDNADALTNLFSTNQKSDAVLGFKTKSVSDYTTARTSYDASVLVYKQTSRGSNTDVLESVLKQSIDTTTAVAQALQSELNFLGAVSDSAQLYNIELPTAFKTLQTNTRSSLSTANSDLSSLLAQKKTLDAAKQIIKTDQQTITLDEVGNTNGSNPISLQISKNNLDKQRVDVAKQQADLADYTIVAPFSGTISAVSVKKGDTASGAVATIITNQRIAQLSLNEVDAAKIVLGQKATLTFDAIDSLTLTGTIEELDPVGTVSQGVVNYNVKVGFDSQDTRIKPGMTANAVIQTAVHQNVLTVPASAVKTQGGQSYVLVFTPPLDTTNAGAQGVTSATSPTQTPVEVGISDDTNTEILSGLNADEQIVVRTISGTPTTATAARTTTGGAAAGRGNATFIGGGGATLRGL